MDAALVNVPKNVPGRVSVVVPSHGHLRFLPERFASIMDQTRRPEELIIIDDGSTDGSAEWLRDWRGDFPVRLECRSTASGSPFAIWNAGVARATGDWVWIAESDDSCEPEFLATVLAAAERHPDAAIIFCQSQLVDADGRSVGSFADTTKTFDTETWRHDFAIAGRDATANLLLARNTMPNVSACLISRRAWLAAGGADTSLNLCGDWLTYARLLRQGSLVFCADPLNRHRHHADTQRSRTATPEYIRQSYVARRSAADLHQLPEAGLEFARRYAWEETIRVLGVESGNLQRALPPAVHGAARAFDPRFDARALEAPTRAWDHCDIFVDPLGAFAESNKRRRPIRVYDEWEALAFPGCAGLVRLDPFAQPGRCWLRRLAMLEAGGGHVLWSADQGSGFAGLRAGPGVALTVCDGALAITCAHGDPQLFLPPLSGSSPAKFDLVVELRYPLE